MMTPSLVEHEGATILGVEVTTQNTTESDPARGRIPGLWARFYREGILDTIPRKRTPALPMGVYTDYESDHTGQYRLLVGAAVEEGTPSPEGLRRATIPAGRYLVFRAEGAMPQVVVETWSAIWSYFASGCEHVRAYTSDFEVYPGPTQVEIYVAVRR